jgi:hypothetical protein
MTGIELIAAERKQQIEEKGFTAEHDDKLDDNTLAYAGAWYALPSQDRIDLEMDGYDIWPFDSDPSEPPIPRIRELEKAGALIAAEIDKLLRLNGDTNVRFKK